MSYVTNCLIHFSNLENEIEALKSINSFFESDAHKQKPFISIEDSSLPNKWYGGSKASEAPLAFGAFNFLDVEALLNHIREIKFKAPECVQLIVQNQDDDKFSIIDVFSAK